MERQRFGLAGRIMLIMAILIGSANLTGCEGSLARKHWDNLTKKSRQVREYHAKKNAGEVGEISRTTNAQEENPTQTTYTNQDDVDAYLKAKAREDLKNTFELYKIFFHGAGRPIIEKRYSEEN
jgi:hypothetical protein